MNKKIIISFSLIIITTVSACSLNKNSNFWKGKKEEMARIAALERRQSDKVSNFYTSENIYAQEIKPQKVIKIVQATDNKEWAMTGLNHQNNISNIYFSGESKVFMKKNIGKNKFSVFKLKTSPLGVGGNIILTDDTGSIFNVNKSGKIIWKKNIYKKIYKKIHKNLALTFNNNKLYVADNIGFVYSLSFQTGEVIWIKNIKIPIKSTIKLFDDKIFIVDQDNKIICLNSKDGKKLWDIRSGSSFIKSQDLLSLAVSKNGDLFSIATSGDLLKVDIKNGRIYWSLKATDTLFAHDNDFFKSSDIVLTDEDLLISVAPLFFSFNMENGYVNWKINASTSHTPIINGESIFFITDNGYFLNVEKESGKIIWSVNILKILKEKNRDTRITGFIMGSGKIYSTTQNGFIIVSSAASGKTEKFIKVGDEIYAGPIITDGSLFVLTEKSKIYGYR
tara:strand:- start:2860 stop:4206 length:1347 start_codon:yes stop_codon:yes gene_type:complete